MFNLCPFFVLKSLDATVLAQKTKTHDESLQKDTYKDLIHLERNIKQHSYWKLLRVST